MGHNSKTKQGGVIRSRAYATHFGGSNRRGAQTSPELSGKHPCLQQRELCKESETTSSSIRKLLRAGHWSSSAIKTVFHSALQNDRGAEISSLRHPLTVGHAASPRAVAGLASQRWHPRPSCCVSWRCHGNPWRSHTLAPTSEHLFCGYTMLWCGWMGWAKAWFVWTQVWIAIGVIMAIIFLGDSPLLYHQEFVDLGIPGVCWMPGLPIGFFMPSLDGNTSHELPWIGCVPPKKKTNIPDWNDLIKL